MAFFVVLGVILAVLVLLIRALRAPGSRRMGGPGAGATGAVYDMLNEDKRKAIEIILEERTGYRDPEHADDIPPDLDSARQPPSAKERVSKRTPND
jgi:hypothetical protein